MWVDFHYPAILGVQKKVHEILREEGAETLLPLDAFIFSLYDQADEFQFFRTSEGDNPPVYHFKPSPARVETLYATFEQYVMTTIEGWGHPLP